LSSHEIETVWLFTTVATIFDGSEGAACASGAKMAVAKNKHRDAKPRRMEKWGEIMGEKIEFTL
jgi:hypothetical protein